ncbi:MAG: NifB/NifX family molybdenum-iron cluster-binding protein [Thermodesulfobacteriota bacterium]
MRIGVTVWGDIISPVFDAAGSLLVAELNAGRIVQKERISLFPGSPAHQIEKLRQAGIDVLICGAVSEVPANMIEGAGIRLISFITGRWDEVLQAYSRHRLLTADFMMPGCGHRRRRRQRGQF